MNDTQNTNFQQLQEVDDDMTLVDLVNICMSKWKWYVASIVTVLALAVLYLLSTPNQYTMNATLLIKDEGNASKARASRQQFDIMGMMFADANVQNELITIKSPTIMAIVVEKLGLNEIYMTKQGLKPLELYKNSPVLVSFLAPEEAIGVSLKIVIKDENTIVLEDFHKRADDFKDEIECRFGEVAKTPIGDIVVSKTQFPLEKYIGKTISYSRSSIKSVANAYAKRLKAELTSKEATAIDLQFSDCLPEKVAEILNTLIESYNEYWVIDQNQVAISTSKFIAERLAMLEQELGSVDSDISSYKSKHLLPDVKAAATKYMEEDAKAKNELLVLMNQKNIAQAMLAQLESHDNSQPLPSNSGITNSEINAAVHQYNTILIERKRFLANSSDKNPIVQDLTVSLETMRSSVIQSFQSYLKALDLQEQALNSRASETQSQIAQSPSQAKYLLSVERQQKVKEALYLYLLQKLEENEISQAFIAYNTRVLTAPTGGERPTSPHKSRVLLLAIFLGVFFPTIWIYIQEIFNTTVRGKIDIQDMSLSYLGEIPQIDGPSAIERLRMRNSKKEEKRVVVVKERSRNVINEAFRVIRTNLDFVNRLDKAKVFMIISMNPGSGKTFVSMNMAASLAIKGSKVAVLDFDLRRASTSIYVNSPKIGITDYLVGDAALEDVVIKGFHHKNLDVIPVGTIPPNPTELLLDPKVQQLFDTLRAQYDYVIVDCPPVDIVADTSIIAEYIDKSIFVIRCGVLNRSVIPQIEEMGLSHKYKNMSIILNGSKQYIGGKYGYHSYNYYSYGKYGSHYHSKD